MQSDGTRNSILLGNPFERELNEMLKFIAEIRRQKMISSVVLRRDSIQRTLNRIVIEKFCVN